MIRKLEIENFKSIKELSLDCKKMNVFIGEPNSGKSNIIEAMSLQSQNAISSGINKSMFRYNSLGDLFHDFNINSPITVQTDEQKTTLSYGTEMNVGINNFAFRLSDEQVNPTTFEHSGNIINHGDNAHTNVRYYEYKRLGKFTPSYSPHLSVPYGENLPNLLLSNATFKKWVSEFFQSKGFILTLKPTENDINLSKMVDGELYSYPYLSISETLQRIVFYEMAIRSNNQSVLLFDEPESNTFPFYTKFIAERMALDETNQFFITTHNPYLLLSLIEKSKFENLNVIVVRMDNYLTKLNVLNENQIGKVLDFNSDVFFNFDNILDL